MYTELESLLHKVSYTPTSDTLVSVGDIVAKGPHKGSMAVLDWMATHNVTAVRGNHDEHVVEWYSWLQWVRSMHGGSKFIETVCTRWEHAQKHGHNDPEVWVEREIERDQVNKKWWKRIPKGKGWIMFGDHFEIARAMDQRMYDYLVSLPLKLHIPHAHTFIAHAGVLSSDPKRKPWHRKQPLANVPKGKDTHHIRTLQEQAVLTDIPPNNDPWVTLNMRSITEDGDISRQSDDHPWSKHYASDMGRCAGFELQDHRAERSKQLPCYPMSVVYGHAAGRGLDVKRWSIGLDSGCVYERRMTALVLGGELAKVTLGEEEDPSQVVLDWDEEDIGIETKKRKSLIKFGDNGVGRLVSVSCH
ncbi:Metallo-dependent phosphatase [Cylindrobasidium torrendii FP15055 ss-10]|uniref:Metallo-dependent phosphatase n=1 Tax=Cylindrobasidium torrendii FP15055 ss-10 TaxID=1314674 RepID=A0A0D7BPJ7_9AGAR|nr:Metallo-dependent phosphatase [Cylindrobasidium torrendii FP15055 ss-10]